MTQTKNILEKLNSGFMKRGLNKLESELISEHLVRAELMGKRAHGIMKAFMMDDAISAREGKPEIIKDKHNYAKIDAHKELGILSADFAVKVLLNKASKFDNAVVATINSYYYTIAGIYAKQIADAGYVGIVLNNGGPATIAPYGGIDCLFGTNPVAIGIPYSKGSIVLDMTTGERPWSDVILAKAENRKLEEGPFLDSQGKVTTDPSTVNAIIPFGGYKGAGLNFMFEILTGAFVSAKMGLRSVDGYDLGFLFMAFSPEMFSTKERFDVEVGELVLQIKSSRKMKGVNEIFLPGESSERKYKKSMELGEVEVSQEILAKLEEFEAGENLKEKYSFKE